MSSNIRIMCPNLKCRSVLVVSETHRGKNVKCANCNTLFTIPKVKSQSQQRLRE